MKNAAQWIGYALFALFLFALFLFYQFPYEQFQDRLFALLERRTGYSFSTTSLKPDLFPPLGFVASDFNIQEGTRPAPVKGLFPLAFPILTARFSLLSYLFGKANVSMAGETLGGNLSLHASLDRTLSELSQFQCKAENLKLEDLAFSAEGTLSGVLSGNLQLSGDLNDMRSVIGHLDVAFQRLRTTKFALMNFPFPQLNIGDLSLNADLSQGKFVIKKLNIGDPEKDLVAEASGSIKIEKDVPSSPLDLRVKFKFSDALAKEFDIFMPLLAPSQTPEGYFAYHITGTLGRPLPTPER
ncbi:MAG: type II secretion system protein GspN [Deltaproteobacteria bacterium]|nr:type II secretion system protein GspN [Deltaproteobacteria bacterium]